MNGDDDLLHTLLPRYSNTNIEDYASKLDDRLKGKLNVVTGPMSSGKTSHLIGEFSKMELQQIPCVILRPKRDTRSGEGRVRSMDGAERSCYCCESLISDKSMLEYIRHNAQVIFIDEAQFFGEDLITFCRMMVDQYRKCVYVYGLNGDSDRRRFGYIADLLPNADSMVLLKGLCATCKLGKAGVFSRAIVKKTDQVQVGSQGAEYVTQCRECYNRPLPPSIGMALRSSSGDV